jgi:S-methylmethionine-dependent homocysteine/selenocysteine methylase
MYSRNNDNPLSHLLSKQGFVILDGGLGTDLISLGYDISALSGLWSAYFLKDSPEVIANVHNRYFDAGADVAITSSYQASFDGFKKEGIDEERGIEILKLSVQVAVNARDMWWERYINDQKNSTTSDVEVHSSKTSKQLRFKPLVAGSIGAYGATIEGAQEFVGNYKDPTCACGQCNRSIFTGTSVTVGEENSGILTVEDQPTSRMSSANSCKLMTVDQLHDWHMLRLEVIGKCEGVDVLAMETIPSLPEVKNICIHIYMILFLNGMSSFAQTAVQYQFCNFHRILFPHLCKHYLSKLLVCFAFFYLMSV